MTTISVSSSESASSVELPSGVLPAHAQVDGINPLQLAQARTRLESLYEAVAQSWPGFIARPGQHQMMHAALLTFLSAKAPEDEIRTGNNLAQLEAGTGTGKTVAYCLAAIVASELLKKTVIVSTATVALQEQLFFKDLPRLAEIIPDLRFDILKGRGRYICESRLEGALNDDEQASLIMDEMGQAFPDFAESRRQPNGISRDHAEAMVWFKFASKNLRSAKWDGDIDTLERAPDPEDWRQVQANANACNGGRCEFFKSCAFFKARRQAATATLQVANHALILATLQTDSTLIDPGNTLFVFDEAHHLPTIAGEQFSYRARLGSSVKLLTSLRTVAMRHGRSLPASSRPDPVAFAQIITECTDKLAIVEDFATQARWVSSDKAVHRFAQGRIPDALGTECEQLALLIRAASDVVAGVASALMATDESQSPAERDERTRAGVELGVYLSSLQTLSALFTAWATHDKVPWAKWVEFADASVPDIWLCASPMTAAQLLSKGLWKNVSAAVCTSATLTACGSFDFFDRLSGLNRFPQRRALVVASPFDYSKQGELRIAAMKNSPKSTGFSDELCRVLPGLLREHAHGQLVLFTSKRQMQACHAAMPSDIVKQIQVQGERSRTELLKEHSRRIIAGERSIIFGLQSFGEGIDLPGELCEHVVIDKLPFTPPNSPVEEALAEWLNAQGRDPFAEISVPRAAMKLAQWSGRGVRTVTDRAVITVCDTRLNTARYGKDILAGLPPFPVVIL